MLVFLYLLRILVEHNLKKNLEKILIRKWSDSRWIFLEGRRKKAKKWGGVFKINK